MTTRGMLYQEYVDRDFDGPKPVNPEAGDPIIFENVAYKQFNNHYYVINAAILTDVNGFKQFSKYANEIGISLATSDFQNLIFNSTRFRQSLVDRRMEPFAQQMLEKHLRDSLGLGPKYYKSDLNADLDSLCRICNQNGVDTAYATDYYYSTPFRKHYFGPIPYHNESELILYWSLLNVIILLIVISFKEKLEKVIQNATKFVCGILLFGFQCYLNHAYSPGVNPLLLLIPWVTTIVTILYFSWSKILGQFRTQ